MNRRECKWGRGFAVKARRFGEFSLGRNLDFPQEVILQAFEGSLIRKYWEILLQVYMDGAFFGDARYTGKVYICSPSSKVLVIQISSRSDWGVSLSHRNHHDSHTKEASRNAEASDGEASKI